MKSTRDRAISALELLAPGQHADCADVVELLTTHITQEVTKRLLEDEEGPFPRLEAALLRVEKLESQIKDAEQAAMELANAAQANAEELAAFRDRMRERVLKMTAELGDALLTTNDALDHLDAIFDETPSNHERDAREAGGR